LSGKPIYCQLRSRFCRARGNRTVGVREPALRTVVWCWWWRCWWFQILITNTVLFVCIAMRRIRVVKNFVRECSGGSMIDHGVKSAWRILRRPHSSHSPAHGAQESTYLKTSILNIQRLQVFEVFEVQRAFTAHHDLGRASTDYFDIYN
jgi:hypothetical protein